MASKNTCPKPDSLSSNPENPQSGRRELTWGSTVETERQESNGMTVPGRKWPRVSVSLDVLGRGPRVLVAEL